VSWCACDDVRGFTPDGRGDVIASEMGRIRIVECEVCVGTTELVRLADRKVPRALTRAERRAHPQE
jgi:hypothetical protein